MILSQRSPDGDRLQDGVDIGRARSDVESELLVAPVHVLLQREPRVLHGIACREQLSRLIRQQPYPGRAQEGRHRALEGAQEIGVPTETPYEGRGDEYEHEQHACR
jgi:hypothetical protein